MEQIDRSFKIGRKQFDKNHYFLLMIFFLNALIPVSPIFRVVNTLMMTFALIYFFNKEHFYLLFPIFIYYSQFSTLAFGLKVFDIYIVLLFLKILFMQRMRFQPRLLIPFVIIALHMIIVVLNYDVRVTLNTLMITLAIILYISNFQINENSMRNFLIFYVVATISASVYGLLNLANLKVYYIILGGTVTAINRNTGTFTDPNYFGFFLNCAIFIVLSLNNKIGGTIKTIVIILLYISLISTLSFTAIICNMLVLIIYILINNKNRFKTLIYLSFLFLIMFITFEVLKYFESTIVTNLIARLESIDYLNSNIDYATSNRTIIWRNHFSYFLSQPVLRILFGGNYITDYGFSSLFRTVSHQTFLDMVLNYGIVGLIVLLTGYIISIFKLFNVLGKNENALALLLIKLIWIFYAFTLSMFPSWIFLIFFLL